MNSHQKRSLERLRTIGYAIEGAQQSLELHAARSTTGAVDSAVVINLSSVLELAIISLFEELEELAYPDEETNEGAIE